MAEDTLVQESPEGSTEIVKNEGAFKLRNDILDMFLLKASHLALLNTLVSACRFTDVQAGKAWQCYPTYKYISARAGMTPQTAQRAAADLEEFGLITRKVRPNRSNVFEIKADRIATIATARKTAMGAKWSELSDEQQEAFLASVYADHKAPKQAIQRLLSEAATELGDKLLDEAKLSDEAKAENAAALEPECTQMTPDEFDAATRKDTDFQGLYPVRKLVIRVIYQIGPRLPRGRSHLGKGTVGQKRLKADFERLLRRYSYEYLEDVLRAVWLCTANDGFARALETAYCPAAYFAKVLPAIDLEMGPHFKAILGREIRGRAPEPLESTPTVSKPQEPSEEELLRRQQEEEEEAEQERQQQDEQARLRAEQEDLRRKKEAEEAEIRKQKAEADRLKWVAESELRQKAEAEAKVKSERLTTLETQWSLSPEEVEEALALRNEDPELQVGRRLWLSLNRRNSLNVERPESIQRALLPLVKQYGTEAVAKPMAWLHANRQLGAWSIYPMGLDVPPPSTEFVRQFEPIRAAYLATYVEQEVTVT